MGGSAIVKIVLWGDLAADLLYQAKILDLWLVPAFAQADTSWGFQVPLRPFFHKKYTCMGGFLDTIVYESALGPRVRERKR